MPEHRLTQRQASELRELLRPLRLGIDVDDLVAHEIRPELHAGVVTSKGLEEGRLEFGRPIPPMPHHLDVPGFRAGLHDALKDEVAGYSMELRQHGVRISARSFGWAKTSGDGGQSWTTGVRMHVASVGKLLTAVAMKKVLVGHGISPDAKIIGYLPGYWDKGNHVADITYRQLMTHRSGFDVPGSASDFETMKEHVAAGVTSTVAIATRT